MATINIYSTPAELRDAAIAIPAETLPMFRDSFVTTLRDKATTLKTGDAAYVIAAAKQAEQGKHDSALRVMLAMGIPVTFYDRKIRDGAQSFNAKAIPKALLIAPLLLSTAPIWGGVSAHDTIRGTIAGLLAGAHVDPKTSLAVYLNDYMSAKGYGTIPGQYNSGGTQSSSSAHALASLGLLRVATQGAYEIVSRDVLLTLLQGAESESESESESEEYAWG